MYVWSNNSQINKEIPYFIYLGLLLLYHCQSYELPKGILMDINGQPFISFGKISLAMEQGKATTCFAA